jgi:hypothetical protein
VRLGHVDLLVLPFPEVGVDHHRAVVAGVEQRRVVAVSLQGSDHSLELPRCGRGAGVEEVPGDVDLEGGIGVFGHHRLVVGEVHETVVVLEYGPGRGANNGDFAVAHARFLVLGRLPWGHGNATESWSFASNSSETARLLRKSCTNVNAAPKTP